MASSGLDPAPRDEALLAMFLERVGSPSRVVLRDGNILTVFNIAWGYDVGDEYSHVTSSVSPAVEGSAVHLFFTNDVDHVLDPASDVILFDWPQHVRTSVRCWLLRTTRGRSGSWPGQDGLPATASVFPVLARGRGWVA
jgi:hypothetical protein